MLDRLVSPLQSSFIPGRSTKDSAIVLQEIIYHMQKKKRKKGDLIFKLDLEKAYDMMNWEFLRDTLVVFGFPDILVSLIVFSISSSTVSLLWKGSKTDCFSPSRSLRQGDPLSPYLFVLCMERLGVMISDAVSKGDWIPLQLSRGGPHLSHLFFADDVLLFTKATVTQAKVVRRVLDQFCAISGLRINMQKSKLFASPGVPRTRRLRLSQVTQMLFTRNIDKYLGFKFTPGRVTKEAFNEVIDRVNSKLASWKGRLLNKPRRLTLTNAVITSIPSYGMQIQWFPQNVCDRLDRIARDFIWRGNNERGVNLVNWNVVTKPRKVGGLGVRTARLQNVALLGKLVWDVVNNPNKLWVSIFNKVYINHHHIFSLQESKGSPTWTSLLKALKYLKDGFNLKIGNGNTSIWYAPWVSKSRLSDLVWVVDIHDTAHKICDIHKDGSWKLDDLYTTLPVEIKTAILRLKINMVPNVPDTWTWSPCPSGIFSVKSAYSWLLDNNDQTMIADRGWGWIWKLKVPANIQFFVWQFCHLAIPTKATLASRGIPIDPMCPACGVQEETIEHCLFHCSRAVEVLNISLSLQSTLIMPIGSLADWLRNLVDDYGILLLCVLWKLWCTRNRIVFDNENASPYIVALQAHVLYRDIQYSYGTLGVEQQLLEPRYISWLRPPLDTICLNVDGSTITTTGVSGFGGLLRDNLGNFIQGFFGSLGPSNITHAELMALLHGLSICWELRIPKVICYSDSLHILNLVRKADTRFHRYGNEISIIRDMLNRNWDCQLCHTLREGNSCADLLAKMGSNRSASFVQLDNPPSELVTLLQSDARETIFVRL